MLLLLLASNAISWANHWTPNPNQFSDNMNIIGVLEINGVEQSMDMFEVGVFCGDECRGSEMLTYYSGVDRHMLFMTLYGQSGDVMSFRLYDHGSQRELVLTPPETIQFVPNDILGSIPDPYVISFSGGIAVITATAVPDASGTITGAAAYWIGETCTLQATANEGYTFVDWTEDGQQVSTEPTLSIFVMESRDLQANFSVNSYEIMVEVQPGEGGSVTGQGTYDYGMLVTVSASPNDHYEFVNWTEDGMMLSDMVDFTFMVSGDRHLIATFAEECITIKADVFPDNAGIIEGMGNYAYGQTATLKAFPNDNYEFVEWTEDGAFVSNQSSITFAVTQDRYLEAHFGYYDGISEPKHKVSIFPNPTSGIFTVAGATADCEMKILNANGELCLSTKSNGDSMFDIRHYPRGIYFFVVKDRLNVFVYKIVLQ